MLTVRLTDARRQRGLSLVELMVGIAVGLVVLAASVLVVTGQLTENRRLLLDTQLQQDLRATADIITRQLRRAGAWTRADMGVWQPGVPAIRNWNSSIDETGGGTEITFDYQRAPGLDGPYGFKLEDGVIKSLLSTAGWQDLTDTNVMIVTSFSVTPSGDDVTYTIPCPKACTADPADANATACWPTLTMRRYVVDIAARSRTDENVVRSIRSQVRVRNELVAFNDPVDPTVQCPP